MAKSLISISSGLSHQGPRIFLRFTRRWSGRNSVMRSSTSASKCDQEKRSSFLLWRPWRSSRRSGPFKTKKWMSWNSIPTSVRRRISSTSSLTANRRMISKSHLAWSEEVVTQIWASTKTHNTRTLRSTFLNHRSTRWPASSSSSPRCWARWTVWWKRSNANWYSCSRRKPMFDWIINKIQIIIEQY